MKEISEVKLSCPGSAEIKRPKPEYVLCPKCNAEVEIWSDEARAECEECGAIVRKDRGNLCINWCEFADKCVGEEKFKQLKG